MPNTEIQKRARITRTIRVATSGQEAERTMMFAALGCNLAWGLADAVMYLLRALIDRTCKSTLYEKLAGADAATGQALVAGALPSHLAAAAKPETLELLRIRLVEYPATSVNSRLGWNDFKGALGVFLLVVAIVALGG